jgi:hypothetical protein
MAKQDEDQSITPQPELKIIVANLREQLGNDAQLVQQAFADMAENERQQFQQSFDGRIEYFRQAGEKSRQRQSSVKDYGLQTLKWTFIINAGAAALILAYIGARYGKPEFSNQPVGPLLKAVWPFGAGCFLIIIAGCGWIL